MNYKGKNNPNWQGGNIKTICFLCKKTIYRQKSRITKYEKQFCSNECRLKSLKKEWAKTWVTAKCKVCNKKFKTSKNRKHKTCSKNCANILRGKQKEGEKNPQWKGYNSNITYTALHQWVKRRIPKPELCECCKKEPPRDLANISSKKSKKTYTRDLKNWEWLCRKCHMKKDGRMEKLRHEIVLLPKKCEFCKKVFQPYSHRLKCCSKECANKIISIKQHNYWCKKREKFKNPGFKRCTKCKKIKHFNYFYKHPKTFDKYFNICKKCLSMRDI